MPNTYDLTTDIGRLRLLLNDVGNGDGTEDEGHTFVLSDEEVQAYLDLEGGAIKLAAATAIETNALNEALASKVIRTASGESTDGAKLADAMRALAKSLRDQVVAGESSEGYFDIVDTVPSCYGEPELSGWPGVTYP